MANIIIRRHLKDIENYIEKFTFRLESHHDHIQANIQDSKVTNPTTKPKSVFCLTGVFSTN